MLNGIPKGSSARPEAVKGWWPPWPWPTPDDPPEPTNPLLLVPGLAGSILNVKSVDGNDDGTRVWVCISHADSEYQKLWGKFNKETQKVELLRENMEVVVPDGDGGLFAVDCLDPYFYMPLHIVYYFNTMINNFKAAGYTAGKDLFGFGYDFRQSNRYHSQLLLERLEEVSRANDGKRVDVVTHSMGGLVMKLFLAEFPDHFERLVNRWVAIAAPFQGSPGPTMDALLAGVQLASGWQKYFFISRETFHQTMLESPSVYELLLHGRDFQWPQEVGEPSTTVWLSDPETGEAKARVATQSNFSDLLREVLADNTVTMDGNVVPMPLNEDIFPYAEESRKLMDKAVLPASCKFYNLYGKGLAAPVSVTFGSAARPLKCARDMVAVYPTFQTMDGDTVVPCVSAKADGLCASERLEFVGEHRGLLEQANVFGQVLAWLQTNSELDTWILVDRPIGLSVTEECQEEVAAGLEDGNVKQQLCLLGQVMPRHWWSSLPM